MNVTPSDGSLRVNISSLMKEKKLTFKRPKTDRLRVFDAVLAWWHGLLIRTLIHCKFLESCSMRNDRLQSH